MAAYAAALFFWGWLGDRLNPKMVVAAGMVGSAITVSRELCFQFLNPLFFAAHPIRHHPQMAQLLLCPILHHDLHCIWPGPSVRLAQ